MQAMKAMCKAMKAMGKAMKTMNQERKKIKEELRKAKMAMEVRVGEHNEVGVGECIKCGWEHALDINDMCLGCFNHCIE